MVWVAGWWWCGWVCVVVIVVVEESKTTVVYAQLPTDAAESSVCVLTTHMTLLTCYVAARQ